MPTLTPCGRTQEILDALHKEHFGQPLWGTYFFRNDQPTKKHPTRDDLDDVVPRCIKCGCTTDEHNATAGEFGSFLCLPASLFLLAGCDATNPRKFAITAIFIANALVYCYFYRSGVCDTALWAFIVGVGQYIATFRPSRAVAALAVCILGCGATCFVFGGWSGEKAPVT